MLALLTKGFIELLFHYWVLEIHILILSLLLLPLSSSLLYSLFSLSLTSSLHINMFILDNASGPYRYRLPVESFMVLAYRNFCFRRKFDFKHSSGDVAQMTECLPGTDKPWATYSTSVNQGNIYHFHSIIDCCYVQPNLMTWWLRSHDNMAACCQVFSFHCGPRAG